MAFPTSLAEYDLETGKLLAQVTITTQIKQLVPFRGPQYQIAAITNNSVQMHSLSDLSVMKQHDFGALEVIAADAGKSSIALTLSDHDTQVYSDSLTLLGSQPWPKNAKLNQNQPLAKLAISPDGQWVVSSGVTWWNDCLFWNVSTNKTFLETARAQSLRFMDNSNLVGVQSSFEVGLGLIQMTIDPVHSTVSHAWLCTIPGDDVGSFPQPVADPGYLSLRRLGWLPSLHIWQDIQRVPGCGDATICVLNGKKRFVADTAGAGHRWIAICPGLQRSAACSSTKARAAVNNWTEGHNSALGSSALYEAEPDDVSLYLQIKPTNADLPPLRRRIASLPPTPPGSISIACGIAVSQDQRTLAVRYAQAQFPDYMNVGKKTQNHSVVIYSGLDPVTGRPGNTAPIDIRLITQDDNADSAAREYHNERILHLSPDGNIPARRDA